MEGISVAVGALAGWLVAYFQKLHFEKRSAKLARINEQLQNLYGPLLATLTVGDQTWDAFKSYYWPNHGMESYFGEGQDQLSDAELKRWRTWMVNVFQPLNERVESTILENIHLIDKNGIPESFTKALSHINAYKAVIAQWDAEDYSEHVSVDDWRSRELMDYVKPEFDRLVSDQSKLLGRTDSNFLKFVSRAKTPENSFVDPPR